jgi:hypothetical protein
MKRKDYNLYNILYKKVIKIFIYLMVVFNVLVNKYKMDYKVKIFQFFKKNRKKKLLKKKEFNDFYFISLIIYYLLYFIFFSIII